MDASRRAFLPLPRSSSLVNPPFLDVIKSKHGDILVLPESSTDDDGYWNAEKMVNQMESYPTQYRSVHFFWGMLAKQKKPWLKISAT